MHFYPQSQAVYKKYQWNFGDGTGSNERYPWHHYATYGKYYVCLTVTDTTSSGTCVDTWCDSVLVTAPSPPTCDARFSFYSKSSHPDSVHFYPLSQTVYKKYQWNFGDGSGSNERYPWHHYATYGKYYVCLTVMDTTSSGTCVDTWCDSVLVSPAAPPTCNARFAHYAIPPGDSVHFYPQSQAVYKKYQWSFGDGTGSNERYPWHHYVTYGKYYVCLTVMDTTSSGTCVDTWCDSVLVTAPSPPTCDARFSFYSKSSHPDSVHFYPLSQTVYKKYQWNFGDGTGSNERYPWHHYATYGKYYVCLTVTDTTSSGTCVDTWCDSVLVTAPSPPTCDARFSFYSKSSHPDSVHFYPQSQAVYKKYQWNFGDGSGSNERYPWHHYATYGKYYVCLTVMDTTSSGTCVDTWCDSVLVTAPSPPTCDARFSFYSKSSHPDSVHFYPLSQTVYKKYQWNFGDGSGSNERYPWHHYATYGKYYVCLTVTDTTSSGTCMDTWCDSVLVSPAAPPTCNARFAHYAIPPGDSVHFYPQSQAVYKKYQWNFGDGSGSTLRDPWHKYATYGKYYVCLTVTDTTSSGTCVDTWCDSVLVAAPSPPTCDARFSFYPKPSHPDSVHFYPLSQAVYKKYQWNFGDGTGSNERYPWHHYATYGKYYVCLTVTDTTSSGTCVDTWCDSVLVTAPSPPTCDARFSFYPKPSHPDSVHFYPLSQAVYKKYQWNFGDGTGSNERYPWHHYATYGKYYVCLTVTDTTSSGTCVDTWCDSVLVIAPSQPTCDARFSFYPKPSHPDSVHFYPLSQTVYKKYQWSFGDGSGSNERYPWHLFPGPGTYIVCLSVTDTTSAGTCSDSTCDTVVIPHHVQVYPNPANSAIHFAVPRGTQPLRLEIVDDKGRVVYRSETGSESGFSVHTQGLSSGVYIYRVSNGEGVVQTGKFVVLKDR